MNILFVLEHYHPYLGGAETLFCTLAEALAARNHDVTVLTTRFRPDLPPRETVAGVVVHRINCHNRFLFTVMALPLAWRLANRADLVHTTTYTAAFPACVAARLRGKRAVITFHEYWGNLWFRLPFLTRAQALAYRAFEWFVLSLPFDQYVAVSDFTARSLVQGGVKKARVTRIYNGLNYERLAGNLHQPPARFTYTYFGRLGISKGLDLLLPAAAAFRREAPDSELVLIIPRRPAAMLNRINQLIDANNLRDYVLIRHELTDEELYTQVSLSSCVVIPSYSEGFCFVAAEAVALGVPIVSSGRGALPETVSGRYVKMEEMTVPGLAKALAKAAAKKYDFTPTKRFPLTDAVKEHIRLYRLLI